MDDTLLRHIRACSDAVLPGGRVRLVVSGQQVGWLTPELADRIVELGGARTADAVSLLADQLQPAARALAEEGKFPWRGEAFDVRATPDGEPLGQIDRGALPAFGLMALGVHVNGLVESGGKTRLWVARRAQDKLLDPGKLDHLVAGGVAAGHGVWDTLLKEAGEEAGLPADLARHAKHVGTISYAMERQEGLRRDCLHCYDLFLPETFVPHPQDREVERFELWELDRVLDTVRRTDAFKFNVNLVLIDLFLRRALLEPGEAAALRRALDRGG
jgi:8-oxo-dGTP pyrophosphatase MutT (NUDIX family)